MEEMEEKRNRERPALRDRNRRVFLSVSSSLIYRTCARRCKWLSNASGLAMQADNLFFVVSIPSYDSSEFRTKFSCSCGGAATGDGAMPQGPRAIMNTKEDHSLPPHSFSPTTNSATPANATYGAGGTHSTATTAPTRQPSCRHSKLAD